MKINYYEIYKNCKDAFFIRLEIVKYYKQYGMKSTMEEFKTTKKTVNKWVKRYNESGTKGLQDKSKKPLNSPNKMSDNYEKKLYRYLKDLTSNKKRIIGSLIKKRLDLPYSLPTVLKAIKRLGFSKHKKKKRQRKRDLRELKRQMKPFEKIQIDVKYLDDIPEFLIPYKVLKLPKFQITARCVKTGSLFYSYLMENNGTNSAIFVYLLLIHLKKYGIDTKQIKIQTDNGAEFVKPNSLKDSLFTKVVNFMTIKHLRIPPGAKTWQSDVECSHRLIEEEFYSQALIYKRNGFFKQAYEYQKEFNYKRKNSYKGDTPFNILKKDIPYINKHILKLKPIVIDENLDYLENINKMVA